MAEKETSLRSTGWTGPEDFLGIPEPQFLETGLRGGGRAWDTLQRIRLREGRKPSGEGRR